MPSPITTVYRRQLAKLLYRRGLTYGQQQSYDAAARAFTQAMESGYEPSAQAQVMRGINRVALQDTAGAIADFDAVINTVITQNNQQSRETLFSLAQAYYHRGRLRQQGGNEAGALADWSAAIAHYPNYPQPYYHRALVYSNQGSHHEALADFDAAIAGDPTLALAYFQRGNLRAQLGNMLGAATDWELAACNDFTLEAAKHKLEQVQQAAYNTQLTQALTEPLAELGLTVKIKHKKHRLEIHIHREVGTGISYYTLPDTIRQHLAPLHLADITHFELIGRVGSVNRPDWQQSYELYKGLPCPPSNWQTAFSALVLFPPFGIPAFIQAAQVKTLYNKGRYVEALRASKAVKGLCIAGSVTLGFFTLLPLGYAAYNSIKEPQTFRVAERPETSIPQVHRPYHELWKN